MSRALGLQLTRRRQKDAGDVPMCGIPAGTSGQAIARLLAGRYEVAVSEQPAEDAIRPRLDGIGTARLVLCGHSTCRARYARFAMVTRMPSSLWSARPRAVSHGWNRAAQQA